MTVYYVEKVIDGNTFEVSPEIKMSPKDSEVITPLQWLKEIPPPLPETVTQPYVRENSEFVEYAQIPDFRFRPPVQQVAEPIIFEYKTLVQQMAEPMSFEKVRLANLNAPEEGTRDAKRATSYLAWLIEDKRVMLIPREISDDTVVADVWRYPNYLFVNPVMVYRRYANWIRDPVSRRERILSEQPARVAER